MHQSAVSEMKTLSRESSHKMANKKKCCLCRTSNVDNLNLGEMKSTGNANAHYYCLLLASTIKQTGKDHQGILGFMPKDIKNEVAASSKRFCTYCKKNGASVVCSFRNCKVMFHLPCGIENQSGHQFYGSFLSNCKTHKQKQRYLKPKDTQTCPICYEVIVFSPNCNVLSAPCCKKKSYLHKSCLQQMALSAGYFFKCPMCNNTEIFQRTMKKFGIFIPDQDASWELEPNAFQELLFRHEECNAETCLCNKGRHYKNEGAWTIILCNTCGSQGTHMPCSKLKKKSVWLCARCQINTNLTQNNEESIVNQTSNNNGINLTETINTVNNTLIEFNNLNNSLSNHSVDICMNTDTADICMDVDTAAINNHTENYNIVIRNDDDNKKAPVKNNEILNTVVVCTHPEPSTSNMKEINGAEADQASRAYIQFKKRKYNEKKQLVHIKKHNVRCRNIN